MNDEIGSRVRELIQSCGRVQSQKATAEAIGMAADAFSRAINGQRAFSSIELAELADLFGADVHWLITGRPDPNRAVVAARHQYESGQWSNPGRDGDQPTLDSIALAYRQAYEGAELEASDLPTSPAEWRASLGDGFVRFFIDRLEERLGIDVVRVPALSTAYCMSIGASRRVIALPATPHWFRENWSLAHELGHLACRHLDQDSQPGERHNDREEKEASAFAAELLMPEAEVRALSWTQVPPSRLATLVWEWGVSVEALANRLGFLGIATDESVTRWVAPPTQRLIRWHWPEAGSRPDPITCRMDDAAARRFPIGLQEMHLRAIDAGRLGASTLAWMMGVAPEALTAGKPVTEVEDDALAAALGL